MMRSLVRSLSATSLAAILAFGVGFVGPLGAQANGKSVFIAGVADAETGQPLEDAEVVLVALRRIARANALGEARLDGVPTGAQVVRVRKLGYAPSEVRIDMRGDTTGAVFRLTRSATPLSAIVIEAERTPPGIRDFERRRRMGIGRYLSADVLDKERDRDFGYLVAGRFPGIRVVTRGTGQALMSSRGTGNCPIQVYLDGVPFGVEEDIWMIRTWDLAGVEFYSTSQVPAEYRSRRQGCGLLLLWSKWF